MKQKLQALGAALMLCTTPLFAHDFEVGSIYYNITSAEDKTVEVTFSGDSYDAVDYEYSGSVTIPETVIYDGNTYSVTTIGSEAFRECISLTSISIPNSVTTINDYAFDNCENLPNITIPNSVTSIGNAAFRSCKKITSITLPNNLTAISNETFSNCINLTGITIPYGVTTIGNTAFYDCYALTKIKIPNSVTTIDNYAFLNCSDLTEITLPKSLTKIGEAAFGSSYNLSKITSYIPADKLIPLRSDVFPEESKTNATLYVPYGAKEAYATGIGWSDFTNIVEITNFNLTVSNAEYSTLYLDCAAEIPEGVEVYTAQAIEGDRLMMDLVEGDVLPANTGVLVKATAGTYTFNYTETEVPTIADNLFSGSATAEYIDVPSNKTAFVLSSVDGNVGMYLAKLTDGQFLNNANKAYLLLSKDKLGISEDEVDTSIGGMQLSLRFDFNGSTGIDGVQTETSVQGAIYDLYGRKLQSEATKGLYIINGKKVLVK